VLLLITFIFFHSVNYLYSFSIPKRTQEYSVLFSSDIPLFKQHPIFKKQLPHINLGIFPTPIHKVEKFCDCADESIASHFNLYIKRDDLCSCNKNLLTQKPIGNYVLRALEFLMAGALYNNAKEILTMGQINSYYVPVISSCATNTNLESTVLLYPEKTFKNITPEEIQNILLTLKYTTNILYFHSEALANIELIKIGREYAQKNIITPYLIPFYCQDTLGAIGFVNAAYELQEQIQDNIINEPTNIFINLENPAFIAGLIVGLRISGIKSKLWAVKIDACYEKNITQKIFEYITDLNESLANLCPRFTKVSFDNLNFNIISSTQQVKNIVTKLIFPQENLLIKDEKNKIAISFLINLLSQEENKNITNLFWFTNYAEDISLTTTQISPNKKIPEQLKKYLALAQQKKFYINI